MQGLVEQVADLHPIGRIEAARRELADFHAAHAEALQLRAAFKPEFLNRVDEIVIFHALQQAQLKSMNEAVETLETQFGTSRPNETLEARMQALALQLQGVLAPVREVQAIATTTSDRQLTPVSNTLSSDDKLKVTLPNDFLFENSNSILRPEASLILDKIITDLRGYPSSTIRIAAHTDAKSSADAERELSFRRAKVIQQYLANALGEQYRWLVVGYGGTRPLIANDTDANRQRNRRVEIAVD